MDRLTYRLNDQHGNPTDSIILKPYMVYQDDYTKKTILNRLADYEDTGLTPDEIRVLQEYHDLYTHEDVEASKYVLSLIEADKKKNELSNI